jgi:hypothetical protein
MLVSFTALLHTNQERPTQLGAFTCYTFETALLLKRPRLFLE